MEGGGERDGSGGASFVEGESARERESERDDDEEKVGVGGGRQRGSMPMSRVREVCRVREVRRVREVGILSAPRAPTSPHDAACWQRPRGAPPPAALTLKPMTNTGGRNAQVDL